MAERRRRIQCLAMLVVMRTQTTTARRRNGPPRSYRDIPADCRSDRVMASPLSHLRHTQYTSGYINPSKSRFALSSCPKHDAARPNLVFLPRFLSHGSRPPSRRAEFFCSRSVKRSHFFGLVANLPQIISGVSRHIFLL